MVKLGGITIVFIIKVSVTGQLVWVKHKRPDAGIGYNIRENPKCLRHRPCVGKQFFSLVGNNFPIYYRVESDQYIVSANFRSCFVCSNA